MSVTDTLEQHPIKAVVTGAVGVIPSIIEYTTPVLQHVALVFGVGVVILTFIIKAKQLYRDWKSKD